MNADSLPAVLSHLEEKMALIVDENGMFRALLSRFLKVWGFAARETHNITEACHLIATEKPFDVLICNYDLADGSAFSLVAWMRERQLNVPTIVPYGLWRPVLDAPSGVELLAQPFDRLELKEAIERANGGRRAKKQRLATEQKTDADAPLPLDLAASPAR